MPVFDVVNLFQWDDWSRAVNYNRLQDNPKGFLQQCWLYKDLGGSQTSECQSLALCVPCIPDQPLFTQLHSSLRQPVR